MSNDRPEDADGPGPAPERGPVVDPAAPGSEAIATQGEPPAAPTEGRDPSDAGPTPGDAAEEEPLEDERRWSLAATALSLLVVLLLGVGLGLWAAPRIAPHLPAGLAPVAAWLTPGQSEAQARVAALEARLADELADIDRRFTALPDGEELEARAQGLVSAAESNLTARIEAVGDSLTQPDPAQTSNRIGRLETGLEGVTAELASLRDQIASGAVGGLSDEAAASIDLYRSELDGLRAEVGRLSGEISGLGARVDAAASAAEARVAEAQEQVQAVEAAAASERDDSAAQTDLALIRAALAAGEPYAEPLDRLAASADAEPPAGLGAAAATGAPTPAMLRASFPDAAHDAIRASISAGAGSGLVARSRAFLGAQVASRSLTPQPGAAPDAVLSRMEDALRRDDLEAALAEAEALPSEAVAAMSGWLAAIRLRAEAEAGLAEAAASVSAMN